MKTLIRPCLDCKRPVRGKPRCADCQRTLEARKRQRRPDLYNDAAERRRRQRVVADHRSIVGDWCPGWERQPAHLSADLTADHVREVAKAETRAAASSSAAAAATPPGPPTSPTKPSEF